MAAVACRSSIAFIASEYLGMSRSAQSPPSRHGVIEHQHDDRAHDGDQHRDQVEVKREGVEAGDLAAK